MHKRNWKKYNRELVQRGSLTFLIDPSLFDTKKLKGMGRPKIFSDALITMLMITKIYYRMPYRALQGFGASILKMSKVTAPMPTYSAICKRARKLKLPAISSRRASVVAIDSSGVKVYGEGEWKVKIHGKSKRRRWLKVHIAIDLQSGEIVSERLTESFVADSMAAEPILAQLPRSVKEVLADGAYDGKRFRERVKDRGARAKIPPPKNARTYGRDSDRDDAVKTIRGLGGDKEARSLWGKLVGYSKRSLVESAFSRMKRLFGTRLFSKKIDTQRVEIRLRCLLMNSFRKGKKALLGILSSAERSRAWAV